MADMIPRCLTLLFLGVVTLSSALSEDKRPNVLFIAIDDLNDWVSAFDGHPKAKTPNLEAFAEKGAIVFQNAHCAGPVCGPSRSALLSGFYPSHTGVYGNDHNMLDAELIQSHATLPEYFSKNGYYSFSRGKIFHVHGRSGGIDSGQWAYDEWFPGEKGFGVDQSKVTSRDRNLINGKPGPDSEFTKGGGSEFAWGPTKGPKEETRDYLTAEWTARKLQDDYEKPFFLAVGISKPHLPFYVPQEFYDLYDPENFTADEIREDDLEDILTPKGKQKFRPTPDYLWLKENGLINEVARAYMAACSYADACLGVIFDGLAKSPHYQNTIVVVWGDHGWHLGEKLRYRKGTAWSESTRVPLMVRLPDMAGRQDCPRPVNLIDLYPTLVDLCGLPEKELDGRSFAPLLRDPQMAWDHPSMTIAGLGNASVVDERWRYIHYSDGTEEVYDLKSDPMEWTNLIQKITPENESQITAVKERLGALMPKTFAPAIPKDKDDKAKMREKRSGKEYDAKLKAERNFEALQ